jgi:hypothetical protein
MRELQVLMQKAPSDLQNVGILVETDISQQKDLIEKVTINVYLYLHLQT